MDTKKETADFADKHGLKKKKILPQRTPRKMNLKEFIKETITEISTAITECNAELSSAGAIVNPRHVNCTSSAFEKVYGYVSEKGSKLRPVHLINFDVAVTVADKTGTKGGIGIAVGSIGLGAQGKSEAENTSSSKLTFSIPVALPTGNG